MKERQRTYVVIHHNIGQDYHKKKLIEGSTVLIIGFYECNELHQCSPFINFDQYQIIKE
jgi:hypothetical protein